MLRRVQCTNGMVLPLPSKKKFCRQEVAAKPKAGWLWLEAPRRRLSAARREEGAMAMVPALWGPIS